MDRRLSLFLLLLGFILLFVLDKRSCEAITVRSPRCPLGYVWRSGVCQPNYWNDKFFILKFYFLTSVNICSILIFIFFSKHVSYEINLPLNIKKIIYLLIYFFLISQFPDKLWRFSNYFKPSLLLKTHLKRINSIESRAVRGFVIPPFF